MDALTDFLHFFLKSPVALLAGCPHGQNVIIDHEWVTTTTLFRRGEFQVELVLVKPGSPEWPGEHRHPHVDTYEVMLANGCPFTRNGAIVEKPDFVLSIPLPGSGVVGCSCLRLHPWDFHGTKPATDGNVNGVSFFSVQHWLGGVPPLSVGLDWEGKPLTEGHNRIQQNLGNTAQI